MITFYCPNCWSILNGGEKVCPICGYSLESFSAMAFEDKLLAALHHPVPERRIMAAQILGNLNSHRAIPEFIQLIKTEENYYLLRAVLLATAKIDHPDRENVLVQASRHSSTLVSDLAKELLDKISQNQSIGKWDINTG